jgi:hypothetical protein
MLLAGMPLALGGAAVAVAQPVPADDLSVRARVEPDGEVLVGQQVTLSVDVLASEGFTATARYPQLRVKDAITLAADAHGESFREEIGRRTLLGRTWRFLIFPLRPGSYRVPGFQLEVTPSGKGESTPVRVPPLVFQARLPAEADEADRLVVTPRLTVEESWDADPGTLLVGGSLTRRLVVVAERSPAELLPSLVRAPGVFAGLGVERGRPSLSDQLEEGALRGRREDRLTYVAEREGRYTLPAVEISWWNLESGALDRSELAPVELIVGPKPEAEDSGAEELQ